MTGKLPTAADVEDRMRSLGEWYHALEILPGLTTPSNMNGSFPQWDAVRRARSRIDYRGKSVLDIGTMDGMWAFEAEAAGASTVVTCDVYQNDDGRMRYERFMLARTCFGSRVVMVPNGDIHDLYPRLDSIRRAFGVAGGFDIIQCLGVLYHVENPIMALRQVRRCCHEGSRLLLETACDPGGGPPAMHLNCGDRYYFDEATFILPNHAGLEEMIRMAGFVPDAGFETVESGAASRITLVARPASAGKETEESWT